MKRILLVVDPQNDFISGSLAVPGAMDQMSSLGTYIKNNSSKYDWVFISLDWHPENHCSFKENGGQWLKHCVRHTEGALPFSYLYETILENVDWDRIYFFNKGQEEDVEEYSVCDNDLNLESFRVIEGEDTIIDVAGIMSEYCVLETVRGLVDNEIVPGENINLLLPYIATMDKNAKLLEYAATENIKVIEK